MTPKRVLQRAALLTKKLMATVIPPPSTPAFSFSVSDPVSAMVCASLAFLSTPAGQILCGDLRGVIEDLINHVHKQITPAA